jgi:hypothetical protein
MAKSVIAVIVEALVLAFGDCGSTAITGASTIISDNHE